MTCPRSHSFNPPMSFQMGGCFLLPHPPTQSHQVVGLPGVERDLPRTDRRPWPHTQSLLLSLSQAGRDTGCSWARVPSVPSASLWPGVVAARGSCPRSRGLAGRGRGGGRAAGYGGPGLLPPQQAPTHLPRLPLLMSLQGMDERQLQLPEGLLGCHYGQVLGVLGSD